MFDIFDKNIINIPRGNSITVYVTPVDDLTGSPIIIGEGDSVVLTVATKTGETVIQKTLTSANYPSEVGAPEGALICEFDPNDTEELLTGEYPYDCLLQMGAGTRVTFVSSSVIITETISSGGN